MRSQLCVLWRQAEHLSTALTKAVVPAGRHTLKAACAALIGAGQPYDPLEVDQPSTSKKNGRLATKLQILRLHSCVRKLGQVRFATGWVYVTTRIFKHVHAGSSRWPMA